MPCMLSECWNVMLLQRWSKGDAGVCGVQWSFWRLHYQTSWRQHLCCYMVRGFCFTVTDNELATVDIVSLCGIVFAQCMLIVTGDFTTTQICKLDFSCKWFFFQMILLWCYLWLVLFSAKSSLHRPHIAMELCVIFSCYHCNSFIVFQSVDNEILLNNHETNS